MPVDRSLPPKKGSVTATKHVKATYKVLISNLVMIFLRVQPQALKAASIMSNTGILYICMRHTHMPILHVWHFVASGCHPAVKANHCRGLLYACITICTRQKEQVAKEERMLSDIDQCSLAHGQAMQPALLQMVA